MNTEYENELHNDESTLAEDWEYACEFEDDINAWKDESIYLDSELLEIN